VEEGYCLYTNYYKKKINFKTKSLRLFRRAKYYNFAGNFYRNSILYKFFKRQVDRKLYLKVNVFRSLDFRRNYHS
jgi:hypothetical protein